MEVLDLLVLRWLHEVRLQYLYATRCGRRTVSRTDEGRNNLLHHRKEVGFGGCFWLTESSSAARLRYANPFRSIVLLMSIQLTKIRLLVLTINNSYTACA